MSRARSVTSRIVWSHSLLARLGREPDALIAESIDVPLTAISRKRALLGIPPVPVLNTRRTPEPHAVSSSRGTAQKRSKGFRWTRARESLLGTTTDAALAARWGISKKAVAYARERRELSGFQVSLWTPEKDALLATHTAGEIAQALSITSGKVRGRRFYLGITGPVQSRIPRFTRKELKELRIMRSGALAQKWGVAVGTIRHLRARHQIPQRGRSFHYWTPTQDRLLGTVSDARVATTLGIGENSVYLRRIKLQIPAASRTPYWRKEWEIKLGTRSDGELAEKWCLTQGQVRHRREQLGIPGDRNLWRRVRVPDGFERLLGTRTDQALAKRWKVSAS